MAGETKPTIERAHLEKLAVLLGERAKASGQRAVRMDDLEKEVLRIINKWAHDKGLV